MKSISEIPSNNLGQRIVQLARMAAEMHQRQDAAMNQPVSQNSTAEISEKNGGWGQPPSTTTPSSNMQTSEAK